MTRDDFLLSLQKSMAKDFKSIPTLIVEPENHECVFQVTFAANVEIDSKTAEQVLFEPFKGQVKSHNAEKGSDCFWIGMDDARCFIRGMRKVQPQ